MRISKPNVSRRSADFELQHAKTKRSPRAPNQGTTLWLPTRTFIWRPKPSHPHLFPTCQRRIRDSSPDPTLRHLELLTSCQSSLNPIDPAVSVFVFLGSEDSGTLPTDSGFAAQKTGLPWIFRAIRPKQTIAPQNSCSARRSLISSHEGSRLP